MELFVILFSFDFIGVGFGETVVRFVGVGGADGADESGFVRFVFDRLFAVVGSVIGGLWAVAGEFGFT